MAGSLRLSGSQTVWDFRVKVQTARRVQTAGRLGMAWRLGTARGLGTAGPGPGDLERPGDLDSERPGDLERPLETSNSRCIVVAFCDNNALFVTKRALQFLNCNALNLKIEAGRAFLWRRVKLRPPGSLSGSGSRAQPGLNFTLNLGVNSYHWNFGGTNFKIKKKSLARPRAVSWLECRHCTFCTLLAVVFQFKIRKGSSSDGLKKKTSCHDCGNEVFPSKQTPLNAPSKWTPPPSCILWYSFELIHIFNSIHDLSFEILHHMTFVAGNTKQIHHVIHPPPIPTQAMVLPVRLVTFRVSYHQFWSVSHTHITPPPPPPL